MNSTALARRAPETKNDPIEELKAAFTGYHGEVKSISDKIGSLETLLKNEQKEREELEAKMNRLGLGGSQKRTPAEEQAEFKALDKFIRTGDISEFKAMSVGSDPDGGYMVTPVFSDKVTTRLYNQSPMRALSRLETITAGDTFIEIDDRGEAAATWVSENQARPATTTPKVGQWEIPVREIYSLQPVTQRLLDDSNFDLGSWVTDKISDKFARTEGNAYIIGDGLGKPRGLLTYPTNLNGDFTRDWGTIQYVKSGNASGLPSDNPADVFKTMLWSLRGPYRKGAVWQMNSNTASQIDKFKDVGGNYLWSWSGIDSSAPTTFLGYPVEINEDFPDIAANAYPVAFGNFKLCYCIVEKAGVKLLQDPYTSKPNVLFYGYRRVGGGLTNDDAVKLLKIEA